MSRLDTIDSSIGFFDKGLSLGQIVRAASLLFGDTSRIEIAGEVLARTTNTTLTVDERVVWESSVFETALGARYVWELL